MIKIFYKAPNFVLIRDGFYQLYGSLDAMAADGWNPGHKGDIEKHLTQGHELLIEARNAAHFNEQIKDKFPEYLI